MRIYIFQCTDIIRPVATHNDLLPIILKNFPGNQPVVIGCLPLLVYTDDCCKIEVLSHFCAILPINVSIMCIVDVVADFMT
ncbi:hypothetical protein CRM91_16535 [Burkholderia ambifaria]|nr:hypothetical protein CRM91_16535 [Burkholderia ambifaria]